MHLWKPSHLSASFGGRAEQFVEPQSRPEAGEVRLYRSGENLHLTQTGRFERVFQAVALS